MGEADILDEAKAIVSNRGREEYGHPSQSFRRIAGAFSALTGMDFPPEYVAIFMLCVKLSRECQKPGTDNRIDIAGYAACLQAFHDAQEARACDPGEKTASESGEVPEASQGASEACPKWFADIRAWQQRQAEHTKSVYPKLPADPDAEVEAAAGCDQVDEDRWVRREDAAHAYGISRHNVWDAVMRGTIPSREVLGRIHVRLSDVRRLAERLRGEGA